MKRLNSAPSPKGTYTPAINQSVKADEVVINYSYAAAPREKKIKQIIRAVAESFGIPGAWVTSRLHTQNIVVPRQVVMFIAKGDYSLNQIATALGGFHHATVLHGQRKIEEAIKDDPQLAAMIEMIKEKVNENTEA
jgi:chromosomal replication initiation ATPase DnaA